MGQELAAQRHPAARLSGPGPGRRQVLAVLPAALLAVLARPAGIGADEAAPVRIGFLGSWDGELAELREGLREVGRAEGPELAIEARLATGRLDRYGPLARELAGQRGLALMVAVGDAAALAAKRYVPPTPVVFAGVADPVGSGLVRSLERPGGAMTGITSSAPDLAVRQLELLKEAMPAVTRVAIVWNAASPGKRIEAERAKGAAAGLGLEIFPIALPRPSDLARLPEALAASRAEAVVALADSVLLYHGHALAGLAAPSRIPVVSQNLQGVDSGDLLAYGAPLGPQIRRAAFFVDRILGGVSPAGLAVEPAPRFDLAINLKTARALDLKVPLEMRHRAVRLIRP